MTRASLPSTTRSEVQCVMANEVFEPRYLALHYNEVSHTCELGNLTHLSPYKDMSGIRVLLSEDHTLMKGS